MMLVPFTFAEQFPLRVELSALVLGSVKVMFAEAQSAIGLPDSQVLGATLSLKTLTDTQHEQGLANVFV